jgi:RAB protein geranylgeranyltransferase component A
MYGGGELPQAFCRVAAVAGALYVLRQQTSAVLLDARNGRCRGVATGTGQVGSFKGLAS